MNKPKKKIYTEPTQERVEAIKKVFWLGERDVFSIQTRNDGYYITVRGSGDYVMFYGSYSTPTAYLEITRILGVNQGSEIGREAEHGCDTGGYGSYYETDLRFWREL